MELFTFIIGLLAYLIGAIPTGYLIAKLNGIADIRAHGSGNIGATNVARFLGKHYFFIIHAAIIIIPRNRKLKNIFERFIIFNNYSNNFGC